MAGENGTVIFLNLLELNQISFLLFWLIVFAPIDGLALVRKLRTNTNLMAERYGIFRIYDYYKEDLNIGRVFLVLFLCKICSFH